MTFLNFQSAANLNKISLHVLVKQIEPGHFMASVPELADCVASAETREAAIAAVGEKVRACFQTRRHPKGCGYTHQVRLRGL